MQVAPASSTALGSRHFTELHLALQKGPRSAAWLRRRRHACSTSTSAFWVTSTRAKQVCVRTPPPTRPRGCLAKRPPPGPPRLTRSRAPRLGTLETHERTTAKALSQIASTASFDKNPQSQERGITLDLGFSAFFAPSTPQFVKDAGYDELQFTIVDCPGHASLIKTVIGGASIIDMLVLVVDATKGFQTQTAEGLVIGEITCGVMLVALNKIDLLAADERDGLVARLTKRIRATMARTRFPHAPVIPVATRGGGESASEPINLQALVAALVERVSLPSREPSADTFLLQADHCFAVRGQGTVLTGTVQRGSVSVGQMVELPSLLVRKKVKSIQMFRKPVQLACRGDRIGLCLAGLEASSFERGIVAAPGTVPTVEAVIVRAERVRYFKGDVASRVKYHCSLRAARGRQSECRPVCVCVCMVSFYAWLLTNR